MPFVSPLVSSITNFDQVNIVSGNRANPLNRTVQGRFYAFRDVVIGNLSDDGVGSPWTFWSVEPNLLDPSNARHRSGHM